MPAPSAADPPWLRHLVEDLHHPDPVTAFIAGVALRLAEQCAAAPPSPEAV